MFNTQILAGSSGQGGGIAQQSLKFNDDETQYLSWTPASAGNRKTYTISLWFKRANISTAFPTLIGANVSSGRDDAIRFGEGSGGDDLYIFFDEASKALKTNRVFRDTASWYHLVLAVDTTQVTDTNRVKVYINGVQETSFASATYPAQNYEGGFSRTAEHSIGKRPQGNYFDGYISNVHFIDGQALNPTSFGETVNGYWKAKDYAGTYGTNGFHLTFADDVVSEGFNVATYNATESNQSISGIGFQPDLVFAKNRDSSSNGRWGVIDSVRGVNKTLATNMTAAEVTSRSDLLTSFDGDGFSLGADAAAYGWNNQAYTAGDRQVAFCWDAGENNPATGHSSVTYTGNGGTQSIKGLGFEPDFVWIKQRNAAENHFLTDSVRGAGLHLRSDATTAESDSSATFTSFDADGFSLTGTGGAAPQVNDNNDTYVAWGWDAGNGSPVSNTDGTITSTVKANPAYGFSIASYTGNNGSSGSFGHGLGVAPNMVIIKSRTDAANWAVGHDGLTSWSYYIALNDTAAEANDSANFNGTAPSSTVVNIGGSGNTNDAENYIAYCFSSVAGYSSISSYTGDGTTDGSKTITTGFRPGFVMMKNTSSGGTNWLMFDSSREPDPTIELELNANNTNQEYNSNRDVTFTNTGFTVAGNNNINGNGDTYIYMAFKGSYSDYVSDVNTDGTIDSRVKANPSYGFSIATYTGTGSAATIGHGLSSVPELLIVKCRSNAISAPAWPVWHKDLASTAHYLDLQTTAASASAGAALWNNTAPTASVFSVGTTSSCNSNGFTYVSYLFHSVAGYSSIGSYTGTGSSGNAVTTGFRPAFVMIKNISDSVVYWTIYDNTREPANPKNKRLFPNVSNAEQVSSTVDEITFTDTGFELNSGQTANESGDTMIYMAFADTREAAFWKDVSGQGNHWTPNNLDYRDSLPDSPANNFAVLNPLANELNATLSEGNLRVIGTSNEKLIFSTFGFSSGKWYFEAYIENQELRGVVGITDDKGNDGYEYGQNRAQLSTYFGSLSTSATDSGENFSRGCQDGDVISFAVDADNGQVWVKLNSSVNTSSAAFATGLPTDETYRIFYQDSYTSNTIIKFNFGQDSTFSGAKPMGAYTDNSELGNFQYAPPAGYLALCTANLPDPTIIDGSEYFNTVLYTGNAGTQSITGVGFDPDFTWAKNRVSGSYHHELYDTVRGDNKRIFSSQTDAELTGYLQFISDGFSLTAGGGINANGNAHVAWNWKAGGTAVSNTAGSITSQVSANTTAGFSIVSYTGTGANATVGHGLSTAPSFVILKGTNEARQWVIGSDALTDWTKYLLFTTAGEGTASDVWNSTAPTSSVFSVGTNINSNKLNVNYIAYCFANTEGYLKAGSYTGNGSSDGTFVHTGFRPAWVMLKRTDASNNWHLADNKRQNPFNAVTAQMYPNLSNAEAAQNDLDFVSNGFKLRNSAAFENASGGTYIYLAFAESPFKFANAR